jgi:hypothetical protein
MILALPQPLVEWTNVAWPDLLKVGGLGAIRFRVVDKLPFGSDAYAMTWRSEVLIRREWIAPALVDLGPDNTLSLRHLWAVSVLAWHEPHHVLEQRGRPWVLYLLRYVWQWVRAGFSYRGIDEEEHAYEHQARLAERWRSGPPVVMPDWIWMRPNP